MSERDDSNLIVYMDGEFIPWNKATVHVFSPVVKYGAAVFEGVRGYWNEEKERLYLFRLREHMDRLELSQRIMRFESIVSTAEMMKATIELMRRNNFRASVHIRPTVYIGGNGESYSRGPVGSFITAIVRPTAKKVFEGCSAQISSWRRISDSVMPPRAKASGNYNNARYAGLQAKKDGYDAAIFLNDRGKVSEGQSMCLFLIRGGVAITPSKTNDILEGITRSTVIDLLQEAGVKVEERDVDRTEFFDATEAFLCGTGTEITPLVNVDGDPIGSGRLGPITQALQKKYFDCAFGRVTDTRGWLTEIDH